MKYFGTDGIRGTYGDVEISEPFFNALGKAVAEYVCENSPENKFIVVGGDTRASTDCLKNAFIQEFGTAEESYIPKFDNTGVLPPK